MLRDGERRRSSRPFAVIFPHSHFVSLRVCMIGWRFDLVSPAFWHIFFYGFSDFRVNGWFWEPRWDIYVYMFDSLLLFFCDDKISLNWKKFNRISQKTSSSSSLVPIDESRELDVNEVTFFFNFRRAQRCCRSSTFWLFIYFLTLIHISFFFDEWTRIDFFFFSLAIPTTHERREWWMSWRRSKRLTEIKKNEFYLTVTNITNNFKETGLRPVFMCFNLWDSCVPSRLLLLLSGRRRRRHRVAI